jgi:DNA-binding transcriptional LysR family regulator
VISGAAEIGFVEDAVQDPELTSHPVHRDQLAIVVHPGHQWAKLRRRLRPKDIMSAEWIMRERGSGTRSVFEQALRSSGVDPEQLRVCLEMPSNESVRAAVEAGAGAAAISYAAVRSALISRQLRSVPFQPIERSFSALTHRERRSSFALRAFTASF